MEKFEIDKYKQRETSMLFMFHLLSKLDIIGYGNTKRLPRFYNQDLMWFLHRWYEKHTDVEQSP